MIRDNETFVQKHAIRILLLLLVVVGVFGVDVFGPKGIWPSQFAEHLAMAVAVSGVLGLTIEFTLHREFARNVFKAAIGYLLPDELKAELKWIYGLPVLCERHVQTVKLELIPTTELLKLKVTLVRVFRNVSDAGFEFPISLGIEEWFHKDHPSRILGVNYVKGGSSVDFDLPAKIRKSQSGISIEPEIVRLGAGERITVSMEFEETKHANDFTFSGFGFPTISPCVIVDAPQEVAVTVRFDHRDKASQLTNKRAQVWQLEGVLLPHQDIRIHWHRKSDAAEWQQT
jgi:hypothetical protein